MKQTRWERFKQACRRKDGLTLVELLAVTMVMAIIAGIVLGIAGYASRRADESRAQAELQVLRTLLDAYRLEQGQYPVFINNAPDTETEDWEDVFGPTNRQDEFPGDVFDWRNHVESVAYDDPWGRAYQYERLGRFSFDLYSHGPTGPNEDYDRIR